MVDVYDVDPNELIENISEELKKIEVIKAPEWSKFAKTGMHKERPPERTDWWHVRVAAVLRKIYVLEPIGVNKLKRKYGGRKHRGTKPMRTYRGSGKVIRVALQQLEKAGFLKQVEKGLRKGRVLTPKGKAFLNNIAKKIKVKI